MKLKFPVKGGRLKECYHIRCRNRDQVALGVFLSGQPKVQEVCNLERGLEGGYLHVNLGVLLSL